MGVTTGRNTVEIFGGKTIILPVAGATKIQEGTLVVLDATGYAKQATKATNITAVGRAEIFVDNTNGVEGEAFVRVKRGIFKWDNDPTVANKVTKAHVMKDCYITDECTVTSLATGSSRAGKVIAVTDDGVIVETI